MEKRIVKEQNQQYEEPTIPFAHKFQKGKARALSSGRVVEDPGVWKVTKQKSPISQPPLLENKFAALAEDFSTNEASSIEQENALAIMEIPKPLQTNEQFMVHSPNKVLHDIITHDVGEVECNISDSNQIAKGIVETEEFDDMWDAIPLEGDVLPRLLTNARKGKKNCNGDKVTRVQPKRSKSVSSYQ
ncbi:hypothetical protein R3W88_033545 [Solanum pinnatisectum]|uniref:Uncharacterized protein n=1 Tax=Solanum pinnatisectum TaxID=50273 RepID=A0AAV9K3V8_9SOLN|nr:hypothetical protein R3W88_033545 [Solanum pinnatisectum]